MVFDFFASFGLACVVMALLCLLTFAGTMHMVDLGLHETGNRYFESLFVYYEFNVDEQLRAETGDGGGFRLYWMPGGMLLMSLLFINLLCGAIIRARKDPKRPGMLIAHGGMLFMLFAGLVAFLMMRESNLPLWEESSFGAEFEATAGGAKVTAVGDGSTAEMAGVEVGDILITVTAPGGDGVMDTDDDVVDTITDYRPTQYGLAAEQFTRGRAGDRLELLVKRGEAEETLRAVFHGDEGNESFNLVKWSIEVGEYTGEALPEKVMVVPDEQLAPLLKKGARRVFFSEALPFEIEITNYLRNSTPRPVSSGQPMEAVGGFYLQPLAPEKNEEANFRGANVRILPKGGGEPIAESLLYGEYPRAGNTAPLTVEVDGRRWAISLSKEKTTLPFKIRLDKFRKIDHPGTDKVKEFTSNVTKLDPGGSELEALIEMNKPLRADGYTVYQAGWGPQNAKKGDLLYTNLVIATNPADKWPEYACWIVAVGLLVHFCQKLYFFIQRMVRKRRRIQEAIAANSATK